MSAEESKESRRLLFARNRIHSPKSQTLLYQLYGQRCGHRNVLAPRVNDQSVATLWDRRLEENDEPDDWRAIRAEGGAEQSDTPDPQRLRHESAHIHGNDSECGRCRRE